MKIVRRLICLALCWAFVFPAGASETVPGQGEADAFFESLFRSSGAVNGIVLIGKQETPLYRYAYGFTDKSKGLPVTEETVFKVASVTKMVSAIGVMRLAEQGKIGLDAPLSRVLGEGFFNPYFPEDPITLRQALSHTSSLLPGTPYAPAPRWENDAKRASCFSKEKPGSQYIYANIDGGLLGSVMEALSGQSLNTYMTENVFAPLGITAAYSAALLPEDAPLSGTYTTDGQRYITASGYREQDADYDDTCDPENHYHATVGSLYISAGGLLKLCMMLSGEGTLDGIRILQDATVRAMRQDQRVLENSSVTGKSPYGLGLFRLENRGLTWYGHQGRWKGMVCDVFFERESHTAVVFIANGVRHRYGYEADPLFLKALDFIEDWQSLHSDDFLIW